MMEVDDYILPGEGWRIIDDEDMASYWEEVPCQLFSTENNGYILTGILQTLNGQCNIFLCLSAWRNRLIQKGDAIRFLPQKAEFNTAKKIEQFEAKLAVLREQQKQQS